MFRIADLAGTGRVLLLAGCVQAAMPVASRANEQDWMNFGLTPPAVGEGAKALGKSPGGSKSGSYGLGEWGSQDNDPAAPKKPVAPSYVGKTFMPSSAGRLQWKVTRTAWTEADEDAYGQFIRAIGESSCKTTHECLTSPLANPRYHADNPSGLKFFADCADLPFVLRAYFAWQNQLPFSFSASLDYYPSMGGVSTATRTAAKRSQTPSFQITGRRHIVAPGPDASVALTEISNIVSTGHFRQPADYRGRYLPDHYPVQISRDTIKPGVVLFDPLGHIAVVYKVTDDGEVHFIDAHPDNSLTRGIYGSEIERAGPESGAGFKAWRPQKLVGAKRTPSGALAGGEVVLPADSELPTWSKEQFHGTGKGQSADWRTAKFFFNGDEIDYFGYVRLRLAREGYRFDPIRETRSRVQTICRELNYRVDAVNAAINARIHLMPQPNRLPNNIYVTQGYWESYATPSRDAQLKSMFRGLREELNRYVALYESGSKYIDYSGDNLHSDLTAAYENETAQCSITYVRTDGTPVKLGYHDVKSRLFKMSFDPHHCIERRWGATSDDELRSCPDDRVKTSWYEAQQRLRNQLVRTIGDRMDFTLEDLRRQAQESSEVGEDNPPDIAVSFMFAHNTAKTSP